MEHKKPDRCRERTRISLRNALFELILEKHYDDITVQDIIDRADVGRSTFYSNYRDKEDLFRGDWERFLDFFVQHINFENCESGEFVPIKHLFQHVADFHPFYRAMVKSRKEDQLFKTGQKYFAERIENKLIVWLGKEQITLVPISILSNYLGYEIFTLLRWWLDENMPYAPRRMDEIFHCLITPGFRTDLSDKEEIEV